MKSTFSRPDSRSGQAMLIAILTLGGAILGATTIAGILMLYQIRAATDSANSAKAIFAADSGVNWALYTYFNPPAGSFPSLSNNAVVSIFCYDATDTQTACDNTGATTSSYAISKGFSQNSRRAFFLDLSGATATFP